MILNFVIHPQWRCCLNILTRRLRLYIKSNFTNKSFYFEYPRKALILKYIQFRVWINGAEKFNHIFLYDFEIMQFIYNFVFLWPTWTICVLSIIWFSQLLKPHTKIKANWNVHFQWEICVCFYVQTSKSIANAWQKIQVYNITSIQFLTSQCWSKCRSFFYYNITVVSWFFGSQEKVKHNKHIQKMFKYVSSFTTDSIYFLKSD